MAELNISWPTQITKDNLAKITKQQRLSHSLPFAVASTQQEEIHSPRFLQKALSQLEKYFDLDVDVMDVDEQGLGPKEWGDTLLTITMKFEAYHTVPQAIMMTEKPNISSATPPLNVLDRFLRFFGPLIGITDTEYEDVMRNIGPEFMENESTSHSLLRDLHQRFRGDMIGFATEWANSRIIFFNEKGAPELERDVISARDYFIRLYSRARSRYIASYMQG